MTNQPHPLLLTPQEIEDLTRYKQTSRQLAELLARGFCRAYIRAGQVILERPHFEAVCRGTMEAARPKVKPPRLAARR